MATKSQAAKDHAPTGDPEHVAYARDYYWTCTCGASANTFTREVRAEYLAENHERYCDGDATVEVRA